MSDAKTLPSVAQLKILENLPDATRLIYGLRDTGYDFNTAAADIIDNSIAANASQVNVRIDLMADGRKLVYFCDDGDGMSAEKLFHAMRYGAEARQNLASLGKFGLGLKTASSSICLCFTVISREAANEPLNKLSWDLEHVQAQNSWEMVSSDVTSDEEEVFKEYCGEKGTMVIWSNCDRLLSKEYEDPGGTKEQSAIRRLETNLKEHLALIYYRFLLVDDARKDTVALYVNGDRVKGWNPFYPEKAEQLLSDKQQTLTLEREDGTVGYISIRAWMLPNSRDLTDDENALAQISNNRQGFYVHREGRVIQEGSWAGVFGKMEPHTSLLRIEFDFCHDLDDAFKVDVKKSRVTFDPALARGLNTLLAPIYREAKNRARRNEKKRVAASGIDHGSSNISIAKAPSISKPSVLKVDASANTATVSNNRGPTIRLSIPVQSDVSPDKIFVEATYDIVSGNLWEPSLRSDTESGHQTGVRINKHHDFYQKIYQRAADNGFAVEGMDILLWAFAVAEQNNVDTQLEPVFEDFREEVSKNLHKLLRGLDLPGEEELAAREDEQND